MVANLPEALISSEQMMRRSRLRHYFADLSIQALQGLSLPGEDHTGL